eukprot:gene14500-14625_t
MHRTTRLVNLLNRKHGLEGFVEFYQAGPAGLPAAYLMHPKGHTLEIFLQEDGRDLLHLRSDASLEPGESINSGIPIAFPQWRDGPLPYNGFADKLQWEVLGTDLDCDFTNTMVGRQDLHDGTAQLLLDENLEAVVPRPIGLLDQDEGLDDEGAEDQLLAASCMFPQRPPPAASYGSAGEQDLDEEQEGEMGVGLIEDPAPCIILKLTDTEETRAIWPHRFELYYKITLMERVHPWTGSQLPLAPEDEALLQALDDEDEETALAAAVAIKAKTEAADRVIVEDFPRPRAGHLTTSGYRQYTDEDGLANDDDDEDETDDMYLFDEDEEQDDFDGGSTRGRKKKAQQDDDHIILPEPSRNVYDPPEEPMQIKLEWRLINNDPEGTPPFRFQLGALSHFKTRDQLRHGDFVRVLGLGGTQVFDWSEDPRRARLKGCYEDYVTFNGFPRETLYINSHDADVMFCPGDRTYFDIKPRHGLPDHVVWHPGALGLPGLELEPRIFAAVGVGRLATPK